MLRRILRRAVRFNVEILKAPQGALASLVPTVTHILVRRIPSFLSSVFEKRCSHTNPPSGFREVCTQSCRGRRSGWVSLRRAHHFLLCFRIWHHEWQLRPRALSDNWHHQRERGSLPVVPAAGHPANPPHTSQDGGQGQQRVPRSGSCPIFCPLVLSLGLCKSLS